VNTRKFQVGDYARPLYVQPYVDWLRLGRPLKVMAIIPCTHGGHCYYRFSSRRGRPAAEIRSDRLRTLAQRYRRDGRVDFHDSPSPASVGDCGLARD
jgi:hypothetical protein